MYLVLTLEGRECLKENLRLRIGMEGSLIVLLTPSKRTHTVTTI